MVDHNTTEELRIARMYISKELEHQLRGCFDDFTKHSDDLAKERLEMVLKELMQKYPEFVYRPFFKVYEALQ